MATVRVARVGAYGLIRRLKILVDGTVVASISRNEMATTYVSSGTHTFTVKMDWVESPPLVLKFTGAETVYLEAVGGPFRQDLELRVRK